MKRHVLVFHLLILAFVLTSATIHASTSKTQSIAGIGTSAAPSGTVCNGGVWMAWKGQNDDKAIYVNVTYTGVKPADSGASSPSYYGFTPQMKVSSMTFSEKKVATVVTPSTDHSPAIACLDNTLYLIWRNSSDGVIYWAQSVVPAEGKTPGQSGDPLMSWTNIGPINLGGFQLTADNSPPPVQTGKTSAALSVAAYDDELYMVFKGNSDGKIYYSTFNKPTHGYWNPPIVFTTAPTNPANGIVSPHPAPFVPLTGDSPAIAASSQGIFLAWKGETSDTLYWSEINGVRVVPGFEPPFVINSGALGWPEVQIALGPQNINATSKLPPVLVVDGNGVLWLSWIPSTATVIAGADAWLLPPVAFSSLMKTDPYTGGGSIWSTPIVGEQLPGVGMPPGVSYRPALISTGNDNTGIIVAWKKPGNDAGIAIAPMSDLSPPWSLHVMPFDLVWDWNNLDYNGLPLNPLWAYQLDPGGQPDFTSICGDAFSNGGSSENTSVLAANCTMQSPNFDIDTSLEEGSISTYCYGLIDGHLTWTNTAVTYTGSAYWDSWSPDPNFFKNFDLQDGDYNLLLMGNPYPIQNGYTDLNWTSNGLFGLSLEFKDTETVNNTSAPWWTQLVNSVSNSDATTTNQIFKSQGGPAAAGSQPSSTNSGLPAVVTGFVSMDGVHGWAEVHPVFSIALDTQQTVNQNNTLTQNWAYFYRTKSNGGGCSEAYYTFSPNPFYIQLPWPDGATSVTASAGESWGWQSGAQPQTWILKSQDPGFTLIKIQLPNGSLYPGLDGQLTLTYTFAPGVKPTTQIGAAIASPASVASVTSLSATVKPASSKVGGNDDEINLADVATRIADPVVKAKFLADAKQAFTPIVPTQPSKSIRQAIPMKFDTPLGVEPRPPAGTKVPAVQISIDPVNKQIHAAIKKLLDTYKPQLAATPPAAK